ncbi:Precorrin-8X methylmutase [bacterium HR40]|nr:Precorrin-8X methylmutase [bacterium HR40]
MAGTARPGTPPFAYLRDPREIYRLSFARIRAEIDLSTFAPTCHALVLRLVHACGMPDLVADLRLSGEPVTAARAALERGKAILCDTEMVRAGIATRRLPASNPLLCTLASPEVDELAQRFATTRAAAAVELWQPWLDGAVVAIGNAPTTLFHLLERLLAGWPRPAAIFAFPVGFVGAAESKEALLEAGLDIPFVTLLGRRGGSALAAAAVNAVLCSDDAP